jgi:putative nucleotidyltransferase with HDIG domain
MIELDEDLWFGTPGEDAELEERAAESMAAVAARVLGAKPFPAAAKRLEELTRSPNTKIQQVVAVLESDPGLSMRLLRLVNSAGYALRVRCTSVRHAAALVGMRRLHQLATTAAVLDLFDGDRPVVRQLLTHAAIVGALSRYLAVHVDLHPDELFTCGFLHDIGKLMLLDAEGESYLELVEMAGDQADTLHLFERERYGFDHAVLGAHVLKSWKIPDPVPRVVAWHHSVGRAYQADPATAATVQALRLADNLSYLVRAPDAAAALKQAAESDSARYLGISEPQLAAMWQDLARLAQRIGANPAAGNEADMIPREDSMPPELRARTSLAAKAEPFKGSLSPQAEPLVEAPMSEVPKHFVCVVCGKATHGSRCPVCSGHVCSAHQVGAEQWCIDCANVYSLEVGDSRIPLWGRVGAAGAIGVAGLISVIVALLSEKPLLEAFVGAVLLSSVVVVLVAVVRRVFLKRLFLSSRARVVDIESDRLDPPAAETTTPAGEARRAEERAVAETEHALPAGSFPSHAPLPFGLSVPPAPLIQSHSERFRTSQPVTEPPAPPIVSPPAEPERDVFRPVERTEPALRLVPQAFPKSNDDLPAVLSVPAPEPTPSVPAGAPVSLPSAARPSASPTQPAAAPAAPLSIPAPIRALTPLPPAPAVALPPSGVEKIGRHNTHGSVSLVGCVSAPPRFNACTTPSMSAPHLTETPTLRSEGRRASTAP